MREESDGHEGTIKHQHVANVRQALTGLIDIVRLEWSKLSLEWSLTALAACSKQSLPVGSRCHHRNGILHQVRDGLVSFAYVCIRSE